jgi:hypothetical protein
MIESHLLVYAVALIGAYLLIANRLLLLGKRIRGKATEKAFALLDDPNVPDALKEKIEASLPGITSAWITWCFALGIIPAIAIYFYRRETGKKRPSEYPSPSAPYWQDWDDFMDYYVAAALCNSPAAAALFIIQIFLVSFFVFPHIVFSRLISGVAKHAFPEDRKHKHRAA